MWVVADVNGDGKDDLCARDSAGFGCWLSDGARFEQRIEGPRWSDAAGFTLAKYYGTLRMGDVNGDRLADVCVRGGAGVACPQCDGMGFPAGIPGPARSDDSGFGGREYWSTLRLADVDGDGRADLCVRTSADLRCTLSTGEGFGETLTVGALSNASGWADPANYRTLRAGDIDGDGADDLCLRANSGMACWAWDGAAFVQRTGPAWADDAGWGAGPQYYDTVRLADFDGDGLEDLCARAGAGWRCHPSLGDSFGEGVALDDLTDAGGWAAPRYWSTIMSAGDACRAEMEACNGRDDDCDGMVDEHVVEESCNATDDDCDGEIDEDLTCGVPPDSDGGTSGADAGGGRVHVEGCACRAGGAGGDAPILLMLIGLGLVLVRIRRRGADR
jgi:MYXO-CTERM domain-containing protein